LRSSLRSTSWWLGGAVALVLTWLAVRSVDFNAFWHALSSMRYGWLIPAFAAICAGALIRALRWQRLFAAGRRPPLREVLSAMIIGLFFNSVLPARAGEPARVVALSRRAGTSLAETAATAVTERLYDLLALLLLLFAFVPLLPPLAWLRAAGYVALALVVAVLILAVVLARYGQRPIRPFLRPLARIPSMSEERLTGMAASVTEGLAGFRDVRLAIPAFALTVISWLVLAASAWLVMVGFGLDVSPAAGMLVVVTTNLAMVLPSPPAGVGVYEAAVIVALDAYGVGPSAGLSYALVLHALNFFPYLAAGWIVLHRQALRARRIPATSPQAAVATNPRGDAELVAGVLAADPLHRPR
jgi:uncharacterized protein (TIRG00374 family)